MYFIILVCVFSVSGDPNKPKAWSKYAPDSSAYKKLHVEDSNAKSELQNENDSKVKKNKSNKKEKNIDPKIAEKFKKVC